MSEPNKPHKTEMGRAFGDMDASELSMLVQQTQMISKTASFRWDGQNSHDWLDVTSAASLFRGQIPNLPENRKSYERLLSDRAISERTKAIKHLTWDGAEYIVTYPVQTFDGQKIWLEERGRRLSGDGAAPHLVLAILRNIDVQKEAQDKALYNRLYDPLTGLWSTDRLHRGLTYLLSISTREAVSAGFLRLNVTNLDDVNTTYGYETGERLLKAVGTRLSGLVTAPDMVGRLGDMGFGIGVLRADPKSLKTLGESLLKELSDTPYPSPHGELYAELCAGGTLLADPDIIDRSADLTQGDVFARTADEAFLQCQTALEGLPRPGIYAAFVGGVLKGPTIKRRNPITADAILSALNDRRISLAYQPIVEAKTRALHHYECLLRLRRDNGEVISAGQIIMAAEELDLVHFLDRRALALASETLRRDPDIKLALNLSAGTVKNVKAATAYLEALKALGPAAERVTLELTETVALDDPAKANRFCVEARQFGTQFAIDDFGSGYTTFQNLMAIEADTIKIDGSFIQDLAAMPHKQTFVRMMVDLAQTFNVKTVAEMVDSREHADLLMRLGVDYLQGYLFGIPSAAPAWQHKAG